jgi:hypothetical protein
MLPDNGPGGVYIAFSRICDDRRAVLDCNTRAQPMPQSVGPSQHGPHQEGKVMHLRSQGKSYLTVNPPKERHTLIKLHQI